MDNYEKDKRLLVWFGGCTVRAVILTFAFALLVGLLIVLFLWLEASEPLRPIEPGKPLF